MTTQTNADKDTDRGFVQIEFRGPVYRGLVAEAERLTELESRDVTVTEVVRRAALKVAMPEPQ